MKPLGFDGSTKEYPEAVVTCNVNGNTFTLRGLILVILDMDAREGGLLGLDLDTDTLKRLLDLTKQTALHPETKTAVKLTWAEARHVEQEEQEAQQAVDEECPRPKHPDNFSDDFGIDEEADTGESAPLEGQTPEQAVLAGEGLSSDRDASEEHLAVWNNLTQQEPQESGLREQFEKALEEDDSLQQCWRSAAGPCMVEGKVERDPYRQAR